MQTATEKVSVSYTTGDSIPAANLTKSNVEEFAGQVSDFFEFGVGDNPAKLVTALGGQIEYQDLSDIISESGSIIVNGPNDFVILLPRYTSPVRDRFTIGHELGHYFLHSRQGELPIKAFRSGSGRIEWEANWFAAALLMPRDAFHSAWRRSRDIGVIARQFGVSREAAEVRKDVLKL
jgi:hypothetical protein